MDYWNPLPMKKESYVQPFYGLRLPMDAYDGKEICG